MKAGCGTRFKCTLGVPCTARLTGAGFDVIENNALKLVKVPKWGRQRRGWGKAIKAAKRRTAAKAHKAGRKRDPRFRTVRQLG